MIELLEKGLSAILKYAKDNNIESNDILKSVIETYKNGMEHFKKAVRTNTLPKTEEIVNILTQEDLNKVIKIMK